MKQLSTIRPGVGRFMLLSLWVCAALAVAALPVRAQQTVCPQDASGNIVNCQFNGGGGVNVVQSASVVLADSLPLTISA